MISKSSAYSGGTSKDPCFVNPPPRNNEIILSSLCSFTIQPRLNAVYGCAIQTLMSAYTCVPMTYNIWVLLHNHPISF